jgi:hypothetical protein
MVLPISVQVELGATPLFQNDPISEPKLRPVKSSKKPLMPVLV